MDIEQEIKRKRALVEELTDQLMRGEVEAVVGKLGAPLKVSSWTQAGVMAAVAAQVIPSNWEWRIEGTLTGDAYLMIGMVKTLKQEAQQ